MEKIILKDRDTNDLYINDGDSTTLYYLKSVPTTEIKGVLVILPSGGETTENLLKQITLHHLAVEKGLLVLIPSINFGTENRDAEFHILDKIFSEIVKEYSVSKDNFILGGLSNGGMISLSYAEKAVKYPGTTFLVPKGVFALDSPLDKVHLYQYCEREIERNYNEAGADEGKWIMERYKKLYGTPYKHPEKYIEASIYSYGAKEGGNAKYLKQIPLRMYTDFDVEWLMNERHRDLYDWNGTDIIAMVNLLKVMGNKDANVIISYGKGFKLDGSKHPHSWSIMDSQDCLNWISNLLESSSKI
ncbi:hypothetical protein [Flavobacterium hiemivividum]|uniref:Alpha/beta hydrolase n=1 Tax=Flavobacterium hiemivividum TaxID=2541734 RepID=A0A4R5D3K4_9FLAO|nr:hypothetical protein [Flavobacterium hiemivividum]TDE06051.1 hypothetical protein E0F98_00020 [Flavobacterium hiemivividum]